mmetsp:Transcript_11239/g.31639  ORF Transcript_11239/g.31639 Transcript_11239/m.31639 type:complete len:268 (-) Transcript_11239:1133-1936(-)
MGPLASLAKCVAPPRSWKEAVSPKRLWSWKHLIPPSERSTIHRLRQTPVCWDCFATQPSWTMSSEWLAPHGKELEVAGTGGSSAESREGQHGHETTSLPCPCSIRPLAAASSMGSVPSGRLKEASNPDEATILTVDLPISSRGASSAWPASRSWGGTSRVSLISSLAAVHSLAVPAFMFSPPTATALSSTVPTSMFSSLAATPPSSRVLTSVFSLPTALTMPLPMFSPPTVVTRSVSSLMSTLSSPAVARSPTWHVSLFSSCGALCP